MEIDSDEYSVAECAFAAGGLSEVRLTVRQRKVFDFIDGFMKVMGYPPTLREIGKHMGIRSTNGVNDHLRALERKGFIVRTDNRARAIKIVREPAA